MCSLHRKLQLELRIFNKVVFVLLRPASLSEAAAQPISASRIVTKNATHLGCK